MKQGLEGQGRVKSGNKWRKPGVSGLVVIVTRRGITWMWRIGNVANIQRDVRVFVNRSK